MSLSFEQLLYDCEAFEQVWMKIHKDFASHSSRVSEACAQCSTKLEMCAAARSMQSRQSRPPPSVLDTRLRHFFVQASQCSKLTNLKLYLMTRPPESINCCRVFWWENSGIEQVLQLEHQTPLHPCLDGGRPYSGKRNQLHLCNILAKGVRHLKNLFIASDLLCSNIITSRKDGESFLVEDRTIAIVPPRGSDFDPACLLSEKCCSGNHGPGVVVLRSSCATS